MKNSNNTQIFEIFKIEWHRIYLHLFVQTEYSGEVCYAFEYVPTTPRRDKRIKKKRILLNSEKIGDGLYEIKCNMSSVDKRSFLDNGQWELIAITNNDVAKCSITTDVSHQLDSLSRIFSYGKDKYAYNIYFSIVTDDTYIYPILHSFFLKENRSWRKRNYVEEANLFGEKLKGLYKSFVVIGINFTYKLFEKIYPKKGKNILIMSETKPYIWGNLLYIDKRLKERGLDKTFKITYSFRNAVGQNNSALSWAKLVLLLAKQDYIFVDDYVPIFGFLDLGKKTELIQVWHAGVGFKSVGYSRFGKEGSPFPQESCHKKYDYALVGSSKLIDVYSEVFGIENEAFLPVGMPRLDGFLDKNTIADFRDNFYKEYPTLANKKIILFAPTFRGAGQKEAFYDYNWLDFAKIYELCGEEYVFLIKMHPFITNLAEIPEKYSDRIMDFSSYKNINDLYYVTEILITDYSSNYYEYSLMKKPIIFYTPDREMYEVSRGVHRSVKDSAPGAVCDTLEELILTIKNQEFQIDKTISFVEDNFGEYDGCAADKVIDTVLLK